MGNREMDARVHLALYPEVETYARYSPLGDPISHKQHYYDDGRLVPAYTTDLSVWPDIDGEWAIFEAYNRPGYVGVTVEWGRDLRPVSMIEYVTDCEVEITGTWQEAAALGLATCLLKRSGE